VKLGALYLCHRSGEEKEPMDRWERKATEPFRWHVSEAWYESLTVHAFVALRIKSNEFMEEMDQIHDSISFESLVVNRLHALRALSCSSKDYRGQ